ncbi:OmpH family outer membrane protein [Waddlia chondrophila]|uniref:Putative Skp-like protein n=1 Tax=Waddlia chondrophila (strain ATCC VR-1470 / WSU 86-1044) TaxID=716544 RepID=D6YWN8_WADCW|nr:OmpH family outer membrane protein [Waddlia chondrophila]ADI38549.1 putative Skp-like protein precursor [Waddlia chondrophila WSU 86-1044]
MKTLTKFVITGLTALLFCASTPKLEAAAANIGTVAFRTCVEQSKYGAREQKNFEDLKKQMESVLEEKEKALTEISNKFNDPDYLDSLSNEAEAELKHKFRTLSGELQQHQQQYMQILQQTNFKIIQGITEKVNEAAGIVAKQKGLDLIVNDESTFFHAASLDISQDIIKEMDKMFEKEAKKS